MLLVFHSLLTKACNSVFIEKFVSSKLLLFSKLASDNNLLKYSDSSISLKYLLVIFDVLFVSTLITSPLDSSINLIFL